MQLDKTIITKVKEFLKINDELSSVELRSILETYRNRFHPDKFNDDETRKEAEEKFKTASSLLGELKKLAEKELLEMGAKEIAIYEPFYKNMAIQSDLNNALEKIDELNSEISHLSDKNEVLERKIEEKRNDNLEKERDRLRSLYKPSGKKLASLGMVVALTFVIAIMAKVESIHEILSKYSPISKNTLSSTVFVILVAIVLIVVKQYIENLLVSRKVGDICSIQFGKEFLSYLNKKYEGEESKGKIFNESDIFYFIRGNESKFKRHLSFLGFKAFHVETTDQLKDFYLNYLLDKELIEIAYADNLDRVFIIKESSRFSYAHYVQILKGKE